MRVALLVIFALSYVGITASAACSSDVRYSVVSGRASGSLHGYFLVSL